MGNVFLEVLKDLYQMQGAVCCLSQDGYNLTLESGTHINNGVERVQIQLIGDKQNDRAFVGLIYATQSFSKTLHLTCKADVNTLDSRIDYFNAHYTNAINRIELAVDNGDRLVLVSNTSIPKSTPSGAEFAELTEYIDWLHSFFKYYYNELNDVAKGF